MTPRRRLATAEEIAEVLVESLTSVRRHTRRGDYDAFAINVGTPNRPRWRYDLQRLERWIDVKRAS